MTSVWLVTNGGSGEDGDEWLLDSVHATEASAKAEAESNEWHREVEEWGLEGSILTDEERAAIKMARSIMLVEHDLSVGEEFNGKQPRKSSGYWWGMADAIRSLLERMK